MSCKFCYATYNSFGVGKQLPLEHAQLILTKLKFAGLEKVTFAGGEPMLYKDLDKLIIFAKKIGLTTSIITNGSLITDKWLQKMRLWLDWIGISIDSINPQINDLIGRTSKGLVIDYYGLINLINKYQYKLKINTVVNRFNEYEDDMHNFIEWSGTTRWKVFDTLHVEGQNEDQFNKIKSSNFSGYVLNNAHKAMVVEDNNLMSASYLLIDPLGRFYENWGSDNKKSDTLYNHTVDHCLSQISLNREKFLKRGGIYKW